MILKQAYYRDNTLGDRLDGVEILLEKVADAAECVPDPGEEAELEAHLQHFHSEFIVSGNYKIAVHGHCSPLKITRLLIPCR